MFQRILVPTNGSPGSRHAIQAAVRLASLSGADVLALHVIAPPVQEVSYTGFGVIGSPMPLDSVAQDVPPERDRALLEARRVAESAGVPIESRQVRAPQTAMAILELADAEVCDLIVMASDGYGSLLSLFTGSVTARVVSGCDLPVLVVH
jgi:nucleotide-binding universal stress UspA family protein